jgi:hypothetical protein
MDKKYSTNKTIESVDYLTGKKSIKIPKDLLAANTYINDTAYVAIYSYMMLNRNYLETINFSIWDILEKVFGFQKKKTKPKATINKIYDTINSLCSTGIIKLNEPLTEKTKCDEYLTAQFIKEIQADENYVKFYPDEFVALESISKNPFNKLSFCILLHIYLYVKGNTFNGTQICNQNATTIAGRLGYGSTTAYEYLNALCLSQPDYTALLVRNRTIFMNGDYGIKAISYELNKDFKKK